MTGQATPGDRRQLMELFDLCFPGEPGFTAWFFDRVWRPEHTLVQREQGRIAAMLQLLPVTLRQGERHLGAEYVYAVGTRPESRGLGLAGGLLRRAEQEAAGRGSACLLLIPQEPSLFAYYARFGYRTAFSLQEETALAQALPAGLCLRPACAEDLPALARLYRTAMGERTFVERDAQAFGRQLELYGANALVLQDARGALTACGFAEQQGADLRFAEVLGADAARLAAAALHQRRLAQGTWCGPGPGRPFAMAKPLTDEAESLLQGEGAYCNLLFN